MTQLISRMCSQKYHCKFESYCLVSAPLCKSSMQPDHSSAQIGQSISPTEVPSFKRPCTQGSSYDRDRFQMQVFPSENLDLHDFSFKTNPFSKGTRMQQTTLSDDGKTNECPLA